MRRRDPERLHALPPAPPEIDVPKLVDFCCPLLPPVVKSYRTEPG